MLLGAATLAALAWRPVVGLSLAAGVLVHYAMTAARVRWLLAQRPTL